MLLRVRLGIIGQVLTPLRTASVGKHVRQPFFFFTHYTTERIFNCLEHAMEFARHQASRSVVIEQSGRVD